MGAGGGGFFMFYHKGNNTEKTAFIKAMSKVNLIRMRYNFDFEGSKIILNMKNIWEDNYEKWKTNRTVLWWN